MDRGREEGRERHEKNAGLPAAHVEHVAADADVDPAGPYLPAAQTVPEHEVAPVTAEYLPANTSPLSAHLPRTRAYPAPRMWRHAGGRALVSSLYQGNATAN